MHVMVEPRYDDKIDVLGAKVSDLGSQIKEGFRRVDAELREQREETKAEFVAVRSEMKADSIALRGEIKAESTALRDEMKDGFNRIDDRLERMQRQMFQFSGSLVVALIGVIGVLITQL